MNTNLIRPFKARLTISEVHCSNGDSYIEIEIEDKDSGCFISNIKLDHATFAKALFAHADIDGDGELLRNLDKIGKAHEYKSENVEFIVDDSTKFIMYPERYEAEISKALQEFEIDGWTARKRDIKNHHYHRHTAHNTPKRGQDVVCYSIGFDRWVDKED